MTVVNIKVQVPANGTDVPAAGSLRWEPVGRRVGPDGALILKEGFPVQLVLGEAMVDVDPGPWRVAELFIGQPVKYKHVEVPETGPVNYTELIEVDPDTLAVALTVIPDPDYPGFYLIGA